MKNINWFPLATLWLLAVIPPAALAAEADLRLHGLQLMV